MCLILRVFKKIWILGIDGKIAVYYNNCILIHYQISRLALYYTKGFVMSNKLLHTPEGVRDIYNGECKRKSVLQDTLSATIKSYGYNAIQTPTFEFFDIFSRDIGTTPSKDLYKFFDTDGETLVLRPDMTPSIARCAAKYFMEVDKPIRLFYTGNTFINNHGNYRGRLNEKTEIGAEYIGDSSVEADAEVVAMMVDCLKAAGLTEFQVSIGEVEFFKSILDEAGISSEDETELRDLISNKNFFGVDEFLEEKHLSDGIKNIFAKLPNMFGTAEVLEEAKAMTDNKGALSAIARLEKLYETLKLYGMEKYVSFDLGMLSKYKYYTGVILKAYTYGLGEPVCTGGRYDKLLSSFGKDAAAIGFVINIDQLMWTLSRQNIMIDTSEDNVFVVYSPDCYSDAVDISLRLRKEGVVAGLYNTCDDIFQYAKEMEVKGVVYVRQEGLTFKNCATSEELSLSKEELIKVVTGR